MADDQIISPYTDVALIPVTPADPVTTQAGSANIPAVDEMTVGVGNEVFHANQEGIWLGAKRFVDALFSVTLAGVIRGVSGFIGGFEIGAEYLRDVGNTFGLSSVVSGADDIRIWAGTTYADRANAEFWVTEGGVIRAQSGTIGGWSLTATTFSSGGISLDSVAETITVGSGTPNFVIDGVNKRIRTSTYSTGLRGFSIDGDTGSAEFNNLNARGEFHSQVLSYGEVHVNAGSQIVSKSAAKLKTDFTSVASPTTFNVDVDDPTTGHVQVFSVGDILQVKDGSGNENWLTISSVSDQTTFFRYVCTKSNGSNATFRAGAAIADWGGSGDGVIYTTADATNAPYISIQTHTGSPWTTIFERVRIGNLNGFLDFVSDVFGIGIGDSSSYMTYEPSTGLRIVGAASVNGSRLGFENIYGDGSDGVGTISSNTTMTRDMFYTDLTIDSGFTLNTGGFRLHCTGTLTVNGTLGRPGNDGTAGGNGTAGTATTSSNTAGTAGTAGVGGAALADGSLKGTVAGTDGTAGGTGQTGANNNPHNGAASSASSAASSVAKSLTAASGAVGGKGGDTGDCGIGAGTSGAATAATAGAAGTTSGTVYNKPNSAFGAWLLQDFFPSVDALKSSAGSSGGTGGCSGAVKENGATTSRASSGGGGGGGGAGSPGGLSAIYAKDIIVGAAGKITVAGGNGGNGGNAGASASATNGSGNAAASGSSGGGGGAAGSGGVLILIYSSLTNGGTITYAAGVAGTGGTGAAKSTTGASATATDGASGANGSSATTGITVQLTV